MQFFTGWQWLLIDAANQFGPTPAHQGGLDKALFEERIKWVEDNLNQLHSLADQAENKPLFMKAVMAIDAARAGKATGHMVGVDACCSGIQIMSALTGCVYGASATGMVDPNRRADAYTEATSIMVRILNGAVTVTRKQAKNAVMTVFYGSKEQPKLIFGEDTPELEAFYQAVTELAPGAWELLQVLLGSWRAYALSHEWKLPDGYDARVKVMKKREVRIEVDELDHASFTYEFYENEGEQRGLSNVANVTHSMDAYVLREMHRRCNYDRNMVEAVARLIEIELIQRNLGKQPCTDYQSAKVKYYQDQRQRSSLASAVILPYITEDTVECLDTEHLQALAAITENMLKYKPFPLVTVHDEFKAHANNVNWVRWTYKEILAEIAESNVLDDLLTQIYGTPGTFDKLTFNLAAQIRDSNYALC